MHKVLVTGATGFIGSHLLDLLLHNDFDVTIIKRSSSDTCRIEQHLTSITVFDIDMIPLKEIFSKSTFNTVIHLATSYIKKDAEANLAKMYAFNVDFAKQLLNLSVESKVPTFINTSSYFQYSPDNLPMTESNKHDPFNEYAKTKTKFQQYLKTFANQINIYDFILFSPYGPRDNDKLVMHVIKKALSKETIHLSEGLQKIDLVYVKDIVDAYLKAIMIVPKSNGFYYDINLAGGRPISIREIVSLIEEIEKITVEKKWGAPAFGDYPLIYADVAKAKEIINWEPTTHIKQGLSETIQHCKGQG